VKKSPTARTPLPTPRRKRSFWPDKNDSYFSLWRPTTWENNDYPLGMKEEGKQEQFSCGLFSSISNACITIFNFHL
jgi:hypothetical protein